MCGWPTPERADTDVFRNEEHAVLLRNAIRNAEVGSIVYCPGRIGCGWPVALLMAFDTPGRVKWTPFLLPLGLLAWPFVFALEICLAPITLTGITLYNCIKQHKARGVVAEAERRYNAYIQHEVERNGYIWREEPTPE